MYSRFFYYVKNSFSYPFFDPRERLTYRRGTHENIVIIIEYRRADNPTIKSDILYSLMGGNLK